MELLPKSIANNSTDVSDERQPLSLILYSGLSSATKSFVIFIALIF
nr:MAG TPA_asm: hypothetical protein [Caudoviricetes sp.]